MKVLPDPVAIWISERGRSSASDSSRLLHRRDLRRPESGRIQRRHLAQARAQRRFAQIWDALFGGQQAVTADRRDVARHAVDPARQRLGPVEGEDPAAARFRIEPVGEAGFDAGGLVEEGQRTDKGRYARRQPLAVLHAPAARHRSASCRPPSPRPRRWPCRRRRAGNRRSHDPPSGNSRTAMPRPACRLMACISCTCQPAASSASSM